MASPWRHPAAAVADGAVMTCTCEDNLRRCMLRSLKDATDLSRGLPLMICSRARLGFALHTFGPAQCGSGLANTQGGGSDGCLWSLEVRPFWPRRASRRRRENEEIGVLQGCSPGMPWSAVWLLWVRVWDRAAEGHRWLFQLCEAACCGRPWGEGGLGDGLRGPFERHGGPDSPRRRGPEPRHHCDGECRRSACFGSLRWRRGRPWDDGGLGDGRSGPPAHHGGRDSSAPPRARTATPS